MSAPYRISKPEGDDSDKESMAFRDAAFLAALPAIIEATKNHISYFGINEASAVVSAAWMVAVEASSQRKTIT